MHYGDSESRDDITATHTKLGVMAAGFPCYASDDVTNTSSNNSTTSSSNNSSSSSDMSAREQQAALQATNQIGRFSLLL